MAFKPVQVNCKNCGASIFFDPVLRISKCNYCGSHILLDTAKELKGDWPDVKYIFEDSISEQQFRDILAKFFCESADVPDDLLDTHQKLESYLSYLPFFLYTVEYTANWTADAGYHYYVKRGSQREKHTRWEPSSGSIDGIVEFYAPASSITQKEKLAEKLIILAEKINHQNAVSYNPEMLNGASWLGFDANPDDTYKNFIEWRVNDHISRKARKMVPGDTHRNFRCISKNKRSLAREMIPFWIFNYNYKGKSYLLLVDAIQGNCEGERPKIYKRIAMSLLFIIIPILPLLAYLGGVNNLSWGLVILWALFTILAPWIYRFIVTNRKSRFPQMSPVERSNAIKKLKSFELKYGLAIILLTLIFSGVGLWKQPPIINSAQTTVANTPTNQVATSSDKSCEKALYCSSSSGKCNVRVRPEISSPVLRVLKKGDIIDCESLVGNWYKLKSGGYVYKSIVSDISPQ